MEGVVYLIELIMEGGKKGQELGESIKVWVIYNRKEIVN